MAGCQGGGSWAGKMRVRWLVTAHALRSPTPRSAACCGVLLLTRLPPSAPAPAVSLATDALPVRELVTAFRQLHGLADLPLFVTGCSCEPALVLLLLLLARVPAPGHYTTYPSSAQGRVAGALHIQPRRCACCGCSRRLAGAAPAVLHGSRRHHAR